MPILRSGGGGENSGGNSSSSRNNAANNANAREGRVSTSKPDATRANARESRYRGYTPKKANIPNKTDNNPGPNYRGAGSNFYPAPKKDNTKPKVEKKKVKPKAPIDKVKKKPKPDTPKIGTTPDSTKKPTLGLYYYQWNLPPHKWSLPVDPTKSLAKGTVVDQQKRMMTLGNAPRYRRGRIYWYSRVGSRVINELKYNDGVNLNDPRYGFQFMWNPDSYTTSVAVNMDITPSWKDKFVDVVGAFPSGEYLNLTVRLDRTNDFACIKSIPKSVASPVFLRDVSDGVDPNKGLYEAQGLITYESLAGNYINSNFYAPNQSFDGFTGKAKKKDKIIELQQLGTLADLEYLYKAINGPGWTNAATGRKTSDIGFLSPTLLRIDLGPVSYLGYVNNMTVNHTSFSKEMIPLRTDVSLQFNLMATAGISAKG
jgi:hypothetical protein